MVNKGPPSTLKRVLFYLKASVLRFLTVIIVLISLAIPSILVYNKAPAEFNSIAVPINISNVFHPQSVFQPYDKGYNYTVMMDIQAHTDVIDAEQSIQWHIANGYNVMVVTDYNNLDGALATRDLARSKYNDFIKVLIGEEWSNCAIHMGFIGISEPVGLSKNPTNDEIKQAIQNVHNQGGLVVIDPIPLSSWTGLALPSREQLAEWGVDFFDVTFGGVLDLQTLIWARDRGIGVVAGSDPYSLGYATAWTLMYVDPLNFTEEAILDSLHSRNTSIMFDAIGHLVNTEKTESAPNRIFTFVFPFLIIGEFFHSYWYQTDSGPYSFVDGYCGGNPQRIFLTNFIFSSIGWVIFLWIFYELVWIGLCSLFRLIKRKIHKRDLVSESRSEPEIETATPLLDLWKPSQ